MAERITAQKVYEYVREQIVSKALFPGNRIVEDELAEALHTSRTTVRNGIAILSYNGLVDVISNYGTFVTKPTLSDMEQAYAVRTVLEVEAMRLAIPRITEGALLRMEKNLEAQRELTRNYSMATYVDLNSAFHQEIVQAAGNIYMEKYLRELYNKTAVFLTFYDTSISNINSLSSHEQMYPALKDRDEAAAVEALRQDMVFATECICIN